MDTAVKKKLKLATTSLAGCFGCHTSFLDKLQIEHALDLQGKRLALFIDAGYRTPAPLAFYAIGPARTPVARSTHEPPPQGVLDVYRQIALAEPPASFVLCVRGERFELGEGLSGAAEAHVEAAWQHLALLCRRPHALAWRAIANNPGSGTA